MRSRFDAAIGLIAQSIPLAHEKNFEDALRCLDQALAATPDFPPALVKRGIVLHSLARYAESIADFDRCLAQHPAMSHVRALREAALLAALDRLDAALEAGPAHPHYLRERAELLLRLERDDEALASYRQAVQRDAGDIAALNGMGNLLLRMNCHDQALACYERALALAPGDAVALFNRANVLQQNGEYRAAWSGYAAALSVRPEMPEASIEQAHCRLATGEFASGWTLFEARWSTAQLRAAKLKTDARQWRGEILGDGEALLLWAEQGLGDTIQFVRYLPLVAWRVAQIVLRVPRSLHTLLENSLVKLAGRDGIVRIIANDAPLPAHVWHCPLMSLPMVFDTRPQTIPAQMPYLLAPQSHAKTWAARLGARVRPRIGLAWAGGQRALNNPTRDMPLACLLPLFAHDADWISLQQSPSEADKQTLETLPIRRFGEELTDLADAAGLLDTLDLVVSIDSALAHLAGALGKPVLLMLRKSGEWRWMLRRDDTPWYPSHRIFRQINHGDWSDVAQAIAQYLRNPAFEVA